MIAVVLVFSFSFFVQDNSREEAVYGTRVVMEMLDCLGHKNSNIQSAADAALEFGQHDDEHDDD